MGAKRGWKRGANGPTRKVLRFGDLIAAAYERCGKARANGLLRLAVNAQLVVFLEQRQFTVVRRPLKISNAGRQPRLTAASQFAVESGKEGTALLAVGIGGTSRV